MSPLATCSLIGIFRLTLFSGPILQKHIVWCSHFILSNLQENSSQMSRNLVRGFVIFVGNKYRITRSTKLTVIDPILQQLYMFLPPADLLFCIGNLTTSNGWDLDLKGLSLKKEDKMT